MFSQKFIKPHLYVFHTDSQLKPIQNGNELQLHHIDKYELIFLWY